MDVKKELGIGLIMTLFVIGLMIFYIFRFNQLTSAPKLINFQTNQTATVGGTVIPSTNGVLNLTAAELNKHNTPADCWIVINDKVLRITPYLNFHPGGASVITQYCGQDATAAFDTKGGLGRPHSSYAVSLLEQFTIGLLGQKINPAVLNQPVNTTNLINSGVNNGEDD
ncbi:MAG TPA: cytochrome b5-like heme/steroid binding domain-containing protein [Patescibacteria group bacterium]